ncbi:twin-arginine translocase TatA/TatE family subunit [Candidatus Shapirobacteria bacterium]|nr:twin-arginine translocase TatA/TatE family subunit [Candidatus Shapirobacteria bacterium]
MFKSIGTTELIVLAVILLVLFGGKKLPELGRGGGEAIKEFRKAFSGKDEDKK